jgi:putative NADH-flavin reductase
MVITVFGATGMVGKRVVSYALAKGYSVRAFGRNVTTLIDTALRDAKLDSIKGSVFDKDEVLKAVNGADAVISVLGGGADGVDKTRSLGMKNIVAQMQKAGIKRIVALGNSAVLSTPDGQFAVNQPGYPQQYLAVGREHLDAYLQLDDAPLDWTFVCAPTINDEVETGLYITSDTYPPKPNKNFIAAGDLAHFIVDEAEKSQHLKQRVGISAS